jgi:hypothetical protein
MTPVTPDLILQEWRRLARLAHSDRVRHRDGTFATILELTKQGGYDFRVKYDDGDVSLTYHHCLFPAWWPEEQWARLRQPNERARS